MLSLPTTKFFPSTRPAATKSLAIESEESIRERLEWD